LTVERASSGLLCSFGETISICSSLTATVAGLPNWSWMHGLANSRCAHEQSAMGGGGRRGVQRACAHTQSDGSMGTQRAQR
jgi:hypothetical protein